MMNMMNRFVEGRGHQREIDMLLELTCVRSSNRVSSGSSHLTSRFLAANKSKAAPSARSATRQPGPFRVSCDTSAQRWRGASRNFARAKAACCSEDVSPAMLTPLSPSPTTLAVSSRRLGRRQRGRRHDIGDMPTLQTKLKSNVLNPFFSRRSKSQYYDIVLALNRSTCVGSPCRHTSETHPHSVGGFT